MLASLHKFFATRRSLLSVIALSLLLAIPARAEERAAEMTRLSSPAPDGAAEPSVFGLDAALGLAGLPGRSSPDDDESAYEKAWRMQDGPNGTTRLTYGERYHRNPDGTYGPRASSLWDGGNMADNLLEQALSAGSGWFSSWAEGWLGGYGKARLSFRLDSGGYVTGAGDFLLPLYDSEYSTFFTQLGLRTMPGDRVIGNFGLGQRFFPAGNIAVGYNVFLDQDFSRHHTRGGAGVEAWYDWLRLSANYYAPLSGWKDSEDYDPRLVEERPAEGYDARLTGYLPFYRHLALTGALEQWLGDNVGSFGHDGVVQKDPKVWSYGLEWTPVPALAASVNQRHSGGQRETQFGLTLNYQFGLAWEDQLAPAMVAEMRTVDGSRHDFVNRQNEIILEYRAKTGADGGRLRLREGLNLLACDAGGGNCRNLGSYTSPAFVTATAGYFSTVNLKVVEVPAGCDSLACAAIPAAGTVSWTVTELGFAGGKPAWWNRPAGDEPHGLYWGGESAILPNPENHNGPAAAVKGAPSPAQAAVQQLTDIVGSRSVTVTVSVNGSAYPAVSETFAFGDGPLSVFRTAPNSNNIRWATAAAAGDFTNSTTEFPAVRDVTGGTKPNNIGFTFGGSAPNMTATFPSSGWSYMMRDAGFDVYYAVGSRLPKLPQLLAVAKYNGIYDPGIKRKGAAFAAGWPDDASGLSNHEYWTGEVGFDGAGYFRVRIVLLGAGNCHAWAPINDNQIVAIGVAP